MRSSILDIATAVLTAIVVVVAFEMTIRIDDFVRFGTPLLSPIAFEDELLVLDALGEHGRPNSRFQKWALDSLGMRGPDVSVSKGDHVVRVVTAGASETFGLYESPGREFPRQLEDSLRRTLTGTHCSWDSAEVINAAIFGMTLPTIDQDLRTRVAPLHPDVVVLYSTPVQYLVDSIWGPVVPDSTPSAGAQGWWASLRPRSVYRLRDQLKEVLPEWTKTWLRSLDIAAVVRKRGAEWRFDSIPPDRLARYDSDLRHAVGTIRAIGATPVLMTHADVFMATGPRNGAQLTAWERFYPRATSSTLIAFDSAGAVVTRRVAEDSAVRLLDLAAVVGQIRASDAVQLFGDYAHFTDRGAALVAGGLRPLVIGAARLPAKCGEGRDGP